MGQEDAEVQSKSRAQESSGTIKEDRRKHVLRLCCDAVRVGLGPSEVYGEFRVSVSVWVFSSSNYQNMNIWLP